MELVIDWGTVIQLLIAAAIAMLWSFFMASKVAPIFVTRALMNHLENINDPNDEIAGAMRRGAGVVFGNLLRSVKDNPQVLSPIVAAFWESIKHRAAGWQGGKGKGLASIPSLDTDEILGIALEEGPDAVAGIAEMFGIPARTARAVGRVGTRYIAAKMLPGRGGDGQVGSESGGKEWWEYGQK